MADDRELLEVCQDVVRRFKAFGSYRNNDTEALKTLRRRVPGFAPEQYRTTFDLLCRIYDAAVSAMSRHRIQRPSEPHRKLRIAKYENIDSEACMAELDEIEPGDAVQQKKDMLDWVIYWHYLK